jgi:flagellar biosynthesis/type III secretory pathway chaperone
LTIQPLLEVLTHIYDVQVKLLAIAQDKKDVIVNNRTDELSRLTNQESKLVKQMGELELKRSEATREYLSALGMKADSDITLTDLAKRVVSAKDKTALLSLQSQLSDVTSRLKDLNILNQELIRNSLDYIEFTLDLLSATDADDMTYGNSSAGKSGFKSGMFDTKA